MLRYFPICLAFIALTSARAPRTFVVRFQWNVINYTWKCYEEYMEAIDKKNLTYIPENNIVSAIKVYNDRLYVAIPRYKDGVPVTLASTSATVVDGETAPVFEPFPDWGIQKINDCSAFQNVCNMEIDTNGYLWVLDTGRTATLNKEPVTKCPPKLVIIDLNKGARVMMNYVFPREVVNYNSVVLNDIVVDNQYGGMAYISDSDEFNPGIVVYSLMNQTSWKVRHQSMYAVDDAVGFKVEKILFSGKINVDGITMSPARSERGKRVVYFSPLSSFNVFFVSTQALVDARLKEGVDREKEIGKHVMILGRKKSQTEGMVMSNDGKLYFGLLADDAVYKWDSNATEHKDRAFVTGQKEVMHDHHLMQWPGSFAFDDVGYLWLFTNRMHQYVNGSLYVDRANFRAMVYKVNKRSYQYYADGSAPL